MPVETLDLDGFLKFLRDKQGEQSDKQFAQNLGVSPQYLCDVYKRRRVPGERLTDGLSNVGASTQRAVVFHVDISITDKEKKRK